VSNFLTNLVRRGAGFAPEAASRLEPALQPAALSAVALAQDDSARVERIQAESERRVDSGNAVSPQIGPANAADLARPQAPLPVSRGPVSQPSRQGSGRDETKKLVRPRVSAPDSPHRSPSALHSISPTGKSPSLHGAAVVGEPSLRPSTTADTRATERPKTSSHAALAPARHKDAEPLPLRLRPASVAVDHRVVPPMRAVTQPSAMQPKAPPPPRIQVRIGKVEVRASPPAPRPASIARPKASGGFAELALARAHLNRNYR
jgi:hypothetical protein